VDRANRPDQKTFKCVLCGYQVHADHNASGNLASRYGDEELMACTRKEQIKALLLRRHAHWKQHNRLTVVEPPVQLGLWGDSFSSPASTDEG